MSQDKPFVTNRDELWEELVMDVPDRYIVTGDGGRSYFHYKNDIIDKFHIFCTKKEGEANNES